MLSSGKKGEKIWQVVREGTEHMLHKSSRRQLPKSFQQVEFFFSVKKLGVSTNQQSLSWIHWEKALSYIVFRKWSLGNWGWRVILSVLLNSSKRLSMVVEILYIVGLDWVLLSSSKRDACPLGYVSGKCSAWTKQQRIVFILVSSVILKNCTGREFAEVLQKKKIAIKYQ